MRSESDKHEPKHAQTVLLGIFHSVIYSQDAEGGGTGEAGRRETAEDGPCCMVLLLHHGRWW